MGGRDTRKSRHTNEGNARFSRPLDPDLFYLICGLSQPGRVGNQDREPAYIKREL